MVALLLLRLRRAHIRVPTMVVIIVLLVVILHIVHRPLSQIKIIQPKTLHILIPLCALTGAKKWRDFYIFGRVRADFSQRQQSGAPVAQSQQTPSHFFKNQRAPTHRHDNYY